MKWNLRPAAANRGICKAGELQRILADAGLVISAGKMSGLWSGNPASIKLDDLDVICAVLGCAVADLLIPEPAQPAAHSGEPVQEQQASAASPSAASPSTASPAPARPRPAATPRRRDHRSPPPA